MQIDHSIEEALFSVLIILSDPADCGVIPTRNPEFTQCLQILMLLIV